MGVAVEDEEASPPEGGSHGEAAGRRESHRDGGGPREGEAMKLERIDLEGLRERRERRKREIRKERQARERERRERFRRGLRMMLF